MGVPTIKELMNPTLDAIRQAGGSALIGEITESVIRDLGLSEEDANERSQKYTNLNLRSG